MTEFCRRMLNEDETDSPETCRERRRRRIEMRRLAAAASASAAASSVERAPPAEDLSLRTGEAVASSPSNGENAAEYCDSTASSSEPTFATLSVAGRCRYMEDMVTVRTTLATPEIARRMPVHFFAVYDGHGGSHVSELCKERMNMIVAEEMGRLRFARGEEAGEGEREEEDQEEWWWRRVMKRSFARMDLEAMNASPDGIDDFALGGSTAAVAVLTPQHIVVANVGDSRAVLCRRGLAVPLSVDHKPNRSDELERIEAAGGRVTFSNGARVEGILAMSRAIGDKYLKRYVISEPEITITKRGSEDQCLIIASDGLWDVLSSDAVCRVAAECLSSSADAVRPFDRITLVAAILTRLALGRRSSDNISIIVVDLRRT